MSEDLLAYPGGLQAGSVLAGYQLEALVAEGGMAWLWRARHLRLNRVVALKILKPALAADLSYQRRFVAEAQAASAVEDPYIITVYDAGEANGLLFIAMRFIPGGDLSGLALREGPMPAARAARFISPVASALDAAHSAGLIHRDVKPANILVDTRPGLPDRVYLSDFGISKVAMSTLSLTAVGQAIGTPDYMAPEQIEGVRAVDGRADQYALACVAYKLLTGSVPFKRDTVMAVMMAHLSNPPPSLVVRRPDLPDAVDGVLAKAMAKRPEERYESCGDFAEALRQALGLTSYSARAEATVAARPAPRPAAAAASDPLPPEPDFADPLNTVTVGPPRGTTPPPATAERDVTVATAAASVTSEATDLADALPDAYDQPTTDLAPASAPAEDPAQPPEAPNSTLAMPDPTLVVLDEPAADHSPATQTETSSPAPAFTGTTLVPAAPAPSTATIVVPADPSTVAELPASAHTTAEPDTFSHEADDDVGPPAHVTASAAIEALPEAEALELSQAPDTTADVADVPAVDEYELPEAPDTSPEPTLGMAPEPADPPSAESETTSPPAAATGTMLVAEDPIHAVPTVLAPDEPADVAELPAAADITALPDAPEPLAADEHDELEAPDAQEVSAVDVRDLPDLSHGGVIPLAWDARPDSAARHPDTTAARIRRRRLPIIAGICAVAAAAGFVPVFLLNSANSAGQAKATTQVSSPSTQVSSPSQSTSSPSASSAAGSASSGGYTSVPSDLQPGSAGASVPSLAFSPSGATLAIADGAGVCLLDIATAHCTAASFPTAHSVAFSPDGTTLAAAGLASASHDIPLWNVATRKLTATLRDPFAQGASSLAFNPEGTTLAVASGSGTNAENAVVSLWDVDTKKEEPFLIENQNSSGFTSVAFSPDGSLLACGDADGSTDLVNVVTRQQKPNITVTGHKPTGVDSLAFSPDGALLAIGDANGTTVLVDVATEKQIATFIDPSSKGVDSVAFSPDGVIMAIGDANGTTYLRDVVTKQITATLPDPGGKGIASVAFSPNGMILATGDEQGNAYLWHGSFRLSTQSMVPWPSTITDITAFTGPIQPNSGPCCRVRFHPGPRAPQQEAGAVECL